MLKKYFLLVFILLSINTITFSETKNESQIVKENTFNTELPKNEGETKKNIPSVECVQHLILSQINVVRSNNKTPPLSQLEVFLLVDISQLNFVYYIFLV